MNIRFYLLWLFVIIILLFFWQLILIMITVNDLLTGIETYSFDKETNKSIPRKIHQMWKTSNLLTYPINNSHSQWKNRYPDYQIILWTDNEIEKLILKEEYKYLYPAYKSYFYGIQRADLARLIILYHEGGIYADLDVFPGDRKIEELRLKNASFIIPRSASDICLINHFLMAEQHSPILNTILKNIRPKSFLKQIFLLPYLEVFSTGSIFLTNIIRKRIRSINAKDERLIILSKDYLSLYIYHDAGRSWHLFDGYLINQIDAYPKAFSTVICVFIFFICFCCLRCKQFLRVLNKFKS